MCLLKDTYVTNNLKYANFFTVKDCVQKRARGCSKYQEAELWEPASAGPHFSLKMDGEVFKMLGHGLRREPWDGVNGVNEAVDVLKPNMIKPPLTRNPGLGKKVKHGTTNGSCST